MARFGTGKLEQLSKKLRAFVRAGPRNVPPPTFKKDKTIKALGTVPTGQSKPAVRVDTLADADWLHGKPE